MYAERERLETDVDTGARAAELRRFLRSRRARLSPADVGLPAEDHRRAHGLRREDVAELAEISVGWYGQFELGRAPNVSARTVETIGHVLRLDDAEMAYLLRLSGATNSAEPPSVPETVAVSAVQQVLEAFTGGPAHVMDRYFNVVAVNEAARVLFGMEPGENIARKLFLHEDRRSLFLNWDELAARFVAAARFRYPGKAGDPEFEAVIAEMRAHSPEFARLWDAGDLGSSFGQIAHVHPSDSDVITLTWVMFPLPDDAEHVLVLSPAVDDESRRRVAALVARGANVN
ncbi:MAG TPA: helix-turn-helix transcriptional regulator [Candidatus Elarobacter sp.]|jgi:transcriptional regulator with XRE-family HTH domain|nr:helix-turn-helix transcriptional regulator [Candidatus Elarobacter sp.]